ncbi:MAG: multicopper oxidase domain-containing protein [Gallionellaceae bacterium]|jgi:FtsP/CotA-like multicopper oxidase with cupredoxin domain
MNQIIYLLARWLAAVMTLLLSATALPAWATIDGISGTVFNLTARADYISTADGNSIYAWGYADGAGTMQYPGPTLIVNQGDTITVNLSNTLPVPVSIIFPGQQGVSSSSGTAGLLVQEAAAMSGGIPGTVSYTFTALRAGTYHYHSGTQPSLQVEMGLVGALIVRPAGVADPLHQAYAHPDTAFAREHLFVLTEIDPLIHQQVESQVALGLPVSVDTSMYHPVLWFINGRNAPDTLLDANVPWLPTQPYNCMPRMHPGEKLLMRVVGGGRDLHPFHTHGNNFWIVARDGRVLESAPGAGPDLAISDFTLRTVPGETYDAIFEWTGKGLGWDVYGHAIGDPLQPNEYAPDHGRAIPVVLPNLQDLTIGPHYSGSPYLGRFGTLPPGQVVLNQNAGYFHMWHSHNEREIVNNDIFPGGMMTMLIIEPASVPIP